MTSLNRVFLAGNLTRDPEVRYLPSGDPVADLRMAINRRYRTKQGEDREETVFVAVAAFARQAETCGQYLRKGSPILVEGRLRLEQWERDGQKQSRLSVVAERVHFLGPPRGGSGPQEYGDAPSGARREPPRPARETTPPRDEGPARDAAPADDLEDEDNIPF